MVADFLNRVQAYGEDDTRLLWIHKVWAFGSYTRDDPTLGDVDLCVKFLRKPEWTMLEVMEQADAEAPPSWDWYHHICWDVTDLFRRIKGRNGYLSIGDLRDIKNAEFFPVMYPHMKLLYEHERSDWIASEARKVRSYKNLQPVMGIEYALF
jgi:predicted nucleotidyltransferase